MRDAVVLSAFLGSFPSRFRFERFEDGGVMLDLESGAFYRMNASAGDVCEGLLRGCSIQEIAFRLSLSAGLATCDAEGDVRALIQRLIHQVVGDAGRDEPRVHRNSVSVAYDGDGFLISWRGLPIVRIDREGRRIVRDRALVAGVSSLDLPRPERWLLWALPHLLVLQGESVIHASSIRTCGVLRAFTGASGAGKTTLARAFADHARDAELISEDLLWLSIDRTSVRARIGGERALRRWAASRGGELAENGELELGVDDLKRCAGADTAPLEEIWFLEATDRKGESIVASRVSASDAFALLLENSFSEVGSRSLWNHVFDACARVARTANASRITLPREIRLLPAAAKAFLRRGSPR